MAVQPLSIKTKIPQVTLYDAFHLCTEYIQHYLSSAICFPLNCVQLNKLENHYCYFYLFSKNWICRVPFEPSWCIQTQAIKIVWIKVLIWKFKWTRPCIGIALLFSNEIKLFRCFTFTIPTSNYYIWTIHFYACVRTNREWKMWIKEIFIVKNKPEWMIKLLL